MHKGNSAGYPKRCVATRLPHACPDMAAESDAAQCGIQRLVLLTTRTADWFEQRGFKPAGAAHLSQLLPPERRQRIDPLRNSQLYSKLVAGAKL